jgi:aryl-alcohol dehydrogenase-like predicted oxidoreductase
VIRDTIVKLGNRQNVTIELSTMEVTMHTRSLGANGPQISEVGLGCWQLGGGDWGDVSDDEALATLRSAYEAGTTLFDTADVYGGGRSEELVGKFRGQCSTPPFIATKLGRRSDPGWPHNFTETSMRTHVEHSLRRLGVDCLDLEQLHCIPTAELRKGDVFETLRTLKAEGKIARFGVSVESDEESLIGLEQPGLSSLQMIFNVFRQKPIVEVFDKATEKGVAIIARVPLASGLLTGKFTAETVFAAADHRNYNADGGAFNVGETFAGLPFKVGAALAAELRGYVPQGWTMTQLALRWILDFAAVAAVIPGAKNPVYAASNSAVSDLPPLTPELHEKLSRFYETRVKQSIRGPY